MNFDLEYEEAQDTHDCEWCTFMGGAYRRTDNNGTNEWVDFYYHHHPEFEGQFNIIVRYGSEGPDYWSGRGNSEVLGEGLRLAISLGYVIGRNPNV